MKKMFIWGAVALVMLGLAGCDDGIKDTIIGKEPDKPATSGDWTKGLTDFQVQEGENPGEIKYRFSATAPVAESYTLYYGTAGLNKAEQIILLDQKKTVTPNDDFTALAGFTPGLSFSVVVEARKGEKEYARSAVIPSVKAKENPTQPQLKLTVSSIVNAPTGKIWGASLLSSSDSQTPIAIGMQDASKVFVFYEPNETGTFPAFNKPFSAPGTYALAIASADLTTFKYEEIYMYKETITYSASITSITVNWSDFTKMGGEQSTASTVITINNKPSNVNILAVMSNATQIAVGANMTGGNTFTLFEPGLLGPDSSKPWKGSGDYSILLLNTATPVATYFKVAGGTTSTVYTFTGQAAFTLNYSTDFVAVPTP